MIIGNNTRQCLRRQRINFNAEPTKCPKYVTRLQSKLQQHGDIIISNTASQENINKLLNNMRSYMPGIRYFKNKNNVFNGININCNNNGFKISGKNIDLFTFLSNNSGIQLLVAIWNDQVNPTYQLTNTEYNNNFKEIDNTDKTKTCSICFEKLGEKMIKTSCGHCFHNNCLKQWLTDNCNKPNCPVCRHSLDIY